MTQIIGSFRKCEFCGFWFGIQDVICPSCRGQNEAIDASVLLAQKPGADHVFFPQKSPGFPMPRYNSCTACVHNHPYDVKNCMSCPNAEEEEFDDLWEVPDMKPPKPRQKPRRRHLLAFPAAAGCVLLSASLLVSPMTERAFANSPKEVSAQTAAAAAEASLRKQFFELLSSGGREEAISWLTRLAKEEATKKPAQELLDWCRKNKTEELAFKGTFENDGVRIGIDGVTALHGEHFRTYIKSGDPLFHGSNAFSVEYMLAGKYATLEAKLLIPAEAEYYPENSESWGKARVTVLGGQKVLATFDTFSKRSAPLSICIPVDGEETLRIIFENCTVDCGLFGMELRQLVVLGDPVLTPAYDSAA